MTLIDNISNVPTTGRMTTKNNIAIIQARMQSTRLPGKILKRFSNDTTLLDFQLATLYKVFDKDKIFIATTTDESDEIIRQKYSKVVNVYRGSENDVLSRFVEIAKITKADNIVRLASDNPFVFFEGIKWLLTFHEKHLADYTTFTIANKPSMLIPAGLFVEIVTANTLKTINNLTNSIEKEHVTLAIYTRLKNQFHIEFIDIKKFFPYLANDDFRFTVDTYEDFKMIDKIIKDLGLSNEINVEILQKIIGYIKGNNMIELMKKETKKIQNSKFYQN